MLQEGFVKASQVAALVHLLAVVSGAHSLVISRTVVLKRKTASKYVCSQVNAWLIMERNFYDIYFLYVETCWMELKCPNDARKGL